MIPAGKPEKVMARQRRWRLADALFTRVTSARHLHWRVRLGGESRVVLLLTATQWLNWGSTYYLLTVLAEPMGADTGWRRTWVIAGLSGGLVLAGLLSPAMGRAIDRHGGRVVLAAGSTALGLGLLGIGLADSLITYFAAWMVLGLGMAASLNDAAVATLGRLYGLRARPLIGSLMLIIGFVMTLWWPLCQELVELLGWRGACFVYAALHILVGLPLHFFLLPREVTHPGAAPAASLSAAAGAAARQSWAIWVLGTNLTLQIAIGSVVAVHLITLLQGRGIAFDLAVWLGSLIWLAQGFGRLLQTMVGRHTHPVWEGVAASAGVFLGLVLLLAGEPAVMAVALLVFGLGTGVRGIVKGTLPLVLFGAEGYATLVGRLALPALVAQAAGPYLGALALDRWGVMATLVAIATLALLNLVLAYTLRRALPVAVEASVSRRN
jgi:MFS family permease